MKKVCAAVASHDGWVCVRPPNHGGMHENEAGEGWGTVEEYLVERQTGEWLDVVPHGGEG